MKNILLREFVKQIIVEAAVSADSAGESGLALAILYRGSKIDLHLYNPDKVLAMMPVILRNKKSTPAEVTDELTRIITNATVGVMTLVKPTSPCNGAWEVAASAADKGFGPLMYDIAMSISPTQTIMSDRSSVSDSAQGVWSYYYWNRKDVKKLPLDNEDDPQTKPKTDDCSTRPPEIKQGKDVNPLNYAYTGSKPVGRSLNQRHEQFMKDAVVFLKERGFDANTARAMIARANTVFFASRMWDANSIATAKE